MTSDANLSELMESEFQAAEIPEQLWQGFGRLGRIVHDLIESLPRDRIAADTSLGLSPAWVLGHLVLLLKTVLEGFGGTAGEALPTDFVATFRPGGDGSEVDESPDLLISLFDIHLSAVCVVLRGVMRTKLSKAPPRDDFGLEKRLPYKSLGGSGAAGIRYAGMYAIELAMLCEEHS